MKKILTGLLLTASLYSYSPKQIEVANHIYQEARKYTKYPSTIVAIAGVESTWGLNRYNKEGSLGVLQIQVDSCKWIATRYPKLRKIIKEMSDAEIAVKLLTDIDFSVMVASYYFEYYRIHKSYRSAVIMFNGWWEVDHRGKLILDNEGNKKVNIKYYNKVMSKKRYFVRNIKDKQ